MTTVAVSANTSWYLYNFRASSLRALLDAGYRVICLTPADAYSERLQRELGCEWLPLPMDNQGSNPLRDAALTLRLWRYYRRLRPDAACHFTIKNNVYGTWAARTLNIPSINTVPGLGTSFSRRGLVPWIARQLYRASQRFATQVFCQNRHDLRDLVDFRLVPVDKLTLIPGSGVDTQRFQPAWSGDADARPFRFMFAGRMLYDKGLAELRQAMEMLRDEQRDCELWLCGFADAKSASAMREAELQDWARTPGVHWLGPHDDMERLYHQVDCVVLPTYYREGVPRSLLEAAACGLPVISTAMPGCDELVEDGVTGLLCQPRDPASLARAMTTMLELAPTERRRMGQAGRDRVSADYDEARVVSATLDAIARAVAT